MPVILQSRDVTIVVKDSELIANGDPETTYTIRQLTRGDYKRAIAAHTKPTFSSKTRGMEQVFDSVAAEDDLLDYALIDWSGVVLPSGEAAPCTRELKLDGLPPVVVAAILERAGLRRLQADEEGRQSSFR